MTSAERRYFMRLLARAKRGDEDACGRLVEGLAKQFSYMLRYYHSVDPVCDRDDLIAQFQLGIWHAIAKVDERGDPLYHLAWRGQRAVCSMLNIIKRRRHGTAKWIEDYGQERSIGTLPEGWDLPDTRPESDPVHVLEVREARDEAHQHVVYVMARVSLTDRQRDALAWMMNDPDPDGEGANKRMAQALGVSAQAAGVLRRRALGQLTGYEEQPEHDVECPACGRGFKTKGALTQHQRGQSGHKPCAGARV